MLEEIRIADLGVIESSTLELGPGLTVVTGETGAGKTMVVTALGLLLGARADTGAVRTGARSARVEGVVASAELSGFEAAVDEAGGTVEDGRVLLARTISAEGRSRAFAGGAGVPVSRLAAIADPLVAVHGQSDQHRLLRASAQRDALDRYGDLAGPLAAYRARFEAWRAAERELAEVTAHARERAQEADLLRFGLGEIEALDPQPGEDAELAAAESRLGFADTLRTAAESARESLSGGEGPAESSSALGAFGAARRALDGVRDHDPEAAALAERLAELSYLLSDLAADVASYASGVETDPARLAAVSARRAALTGLTRKYGDTIDDVLAWAQRGSLRLLELDSTDDRIASLRADVDRLGEESRSLAAELSAARTSAAERLADAVTAELGGLAMPHARLRIQVSDAGELGPHGGDEVEFVLAANTGSSARPLNRGASGGELSRVMLALEVVLAASSPVPTFVFDEVDAGVGGKAAVEVGRRLAMLARHSQVLVVTHLPQVAAYADRHVVVEKASDGHVTTSGLTVLDDAGRVRELSRMLAGVEDSSSALAHARELLAAATPALRHTT